MIYLESKVYGVEFGVPVIGRADTAVRKVGSAAVNAVPEGARTAMGDWATHAAKSVLTATARASRVGLSPERVLAKHQKHGHACNNFGDIRELDLELVDKVRGRSTDLRYAVSGAMAADLAAVLAMASRAVGDTALKYGYDPEEPGEKLFINSVVNFGTASSTAAKESAFVNISRLTQLLVRGTPWAKLNESALTKLARTIAQRLSIRFTQRSLGKLLPLIGIGVGATMNWAMLEAVVDSANIAYRRRFLLEKYPQLADQVDVDIDDMGGPDGGGDDPISIADELPE